MQISGIKVAEILKYSSRIQNTGSVSNREKITIKLIRILDFQRVYYITAFNASYTDYKIFHK